MIANELNHRTNARTVAFGEGNDEILITAMAANLPHGGVAAAKMTGQHALSQSGNRMLDNRILASALRFLDEDLAEPFLAGLAKYRALRKAAKNSLADPSTLK